MGLCEGKSFLILIQACTYSEIIYLNLENMIMTNTTKLRINVLTQDIYGFNNHGYLDDII